MRRDLALTKRQVGSGNEESELVFRPLVKGNEDSGNEIEPSRFKQQVLVCVMSSFSVKCSLVKLFHWASSIP